MSLRETYDRGFDESTGTTISATECPECSGTLVTDAGEISCEQCGLILDDEPLDRGPEWQSFDGEATRARTGAPLTPARHDRGLSTEIGYGNRDAKGNALSARKRGQLSRLRREQSRARFSSKAEQNLALACSEIARVTSALDLPRSVREEASMLYRAAMRADLIIGRSVEAIAAGSVYAACRLRGHTRSLDEVGSVAQCSVGKVELGYRVLSRELGLETTIVRPASLLPQLASACGISETVEQRARKLVQLASEAGIANGRNPSGVAAACLYLATQETSAGLSQAELASKAGVSAPTVRARYYELRDVLDGGENTD